MATGVLGQSRITGYAAPARDWMAAVSRPAAMDTSTNRSSLARSAGASSARQAPMSLGFTPRKKPL